MLLSGSSGMDSILQFITVLLIFVLVLAITYFVTRWVGNYQKMQNYGNNIQILESVRISPSAYVEILQVGKKIIAIAVSKDNVTFLTELNEDEIALHSDERTGSINFSSILEKVRIGQNNPSSSDGKKNDE